MPNETQQQTNRQKHNREIPVRLNLVRSDLYRMARDTGLSPGMRIAAARVLLQYPEIGTNDTTATDHIERLFKALKGRCCTDRVSSVNTGFCHDHGYA